MSSHRWRGNTSEEKNVTRYRPGSNNKVKKIAQGLAGDLGIPLTEAMEMAMAQRPEPRIKPPAPRIAIASSACGRGATTITANLAFSLAYHHGLKIIIVDTSYRPTPAQGTLSHLVQPGAGIPRRPLQVGRGSVAIVRNRPHPSASPVATAPGRFPQYDLILIDASQANSNRVARVEALEAELVVLPVEIGRQHLRTPVKPVGPGAVKRDGLRSADAVVAELLNRDGYIAGAPPSGVILHRIDGAPIDPQQARQVCDLLDEERLPAFGSSIVELHPCRPAMPVNLVALDDPAAGTYRAIGEQLLNAAIPSWRPRRLAIPDRTPRR
jgi:hypothetical protein